MVFPELIPGQAAQLGYADFQSTFLSGARLRDVAFGIIGAGAGSAGVSARWPFEASDVAGAADEEDRSSAPDEQMVPISRSTFSSARKSIHGAHLLPWRPLVGFSLKTAHEISKVPPGNCHAAKLQRSYPDPRRIQGRWVR